MNFSQRKKLILVVFGLLVIAILSFFAVQPNSSSYEGLFSGSSLSNKAQQQAFNNVTRKDSDNDGLKDWEEELWGTDPNNKDTDADGTNDGDEINQNRNPLKAGPDDVLSGNELLSVNKGNNVYDKVELTTTDKFAQDFFQEYLALKGSGVDLDEDSKILLVESTISNILDTSSFLIKYTNSDLNLSENIDRASVRNYGNALGFIIFKNIVETESEMDILNRSLSNENPKEIEKLESSISGYKNISKESLLILVPKDVAEIHINLIENVNRIAKNIEDISVLYYDPIKAIVGIREYEQSTTLFKKILQDFGSYFTNKQILFEDSEAGSVFFNII